MNTKFEKYWDDIWHDLDGSRASHTETWQAAIQSLEVTPELVELAFNAFACTPVNMIGHKRMESTLRAVLSALKEQAK
jgi:hypothetical protein